jgi:hypothetical protein
MLRELHGLAALEYLVTYTVASIAGGHDWETGIVLWQNLLDLQLCIKHRREIPAGIVIMERLSLTPPLNSPGD